MFNRYHIFSFLGVILLVGLVACDPKRLDTAVTMPVPSRVPTEISTNGVPEVAPTATLIPATERLLTICLGNEPTSLFYYEALSTAAQDILAAVYDGPVDIQNYTAQPVILEKLPSTSDGDAFLQTVQVNPGDLIFNSSGQVVNLAEGVQYRPSGCSEGACTQAYSGDQPVEMDQLVLRFKLLPGIQWSDGTLLTAGDSVYSYEIARSLYPAVRTDSVGKTQTYRALDELTVEWVGLPGFQDGSYADKFFTPLPQHAWSQLSVDQLRSDELSAKRPLGWGPYVLDEWVKGDHISLHKNPLYFRAAEGLPHFDNLVFRFVDNADDALDAVLAGECDLVDRSTMFETLTSRLTELEDAGKIQVFKQTGSSWEQITFGIAPYDNQRVAYFGLKEVRQAVAMCIDRDKLVSNQGFDTELVSDSYIPASNPLYNSGISSYGYDPQAANALLESVGWLVSDKDVSTERIAQGVVGVPDGTPFEVRYLVSADARQQADAEAIHDMLLGCGIQTEIITQTPAHYLATGPEGPVFGRAFDLAQFAWQASLEPPCYLYLSSQIPGPYPDFAQGWGGVNASGYVNAQFDQACADALFSLPDSPQHRTAHGQAQDIFSIDLPALPLYQHSSVSVARPDFCHYPSVSAVDSPLWYLEGLDYGGDCS